LTDNLHATANCSKDTEVYLVLAACHAVIGTIADALTKIIILNGGTMRDIVCVCALARERGKGVVLRGSGVIGGGGGGESEHTSSQCVTSIIMLRTAWFIS
jgi:hypothetical protein